MELKGKEAGGKQGRFGMIGWKGMGSGLGSSTSSDGLLHASGKRDAMMRGTVSISPWVCMCRKV